MKRSRTKYLFVLSIIFFLSFEYTFYIQVAHPKSTAKKNKNINVSLTREQLQSAVISFADRFIATVGQAAFVFEEKLPTPEARLNAARRKVYSISAVTQMAAGPYPGVALLDMVVMVTLNRMVWEEYWRPQVFGMPAEIMISAFHNMEKDIWSLAAKVLTPKQIEELRRVIEDWREKHPEQFAVDYIRFSDFGNIGQKPELEKMKLPGGFLAPVKEASRAVDEIRMTSERALFLFTKMQLILGFQSELIYKELVMQPEVTNILHDITTFREITEKLSKLAERLPEKIAEERNNAITQFMEKFNRERNDTIIQASKILAAERDVTAKTISRLMEKERSAFFEGFDKRQTDVKDVIKEVQGVFDRVDSSLTNLQKNTQDLQRLLVATEKTGLVFNDLVKSVDNLADRFESDKPRKPSKPFDIEDYTTALVELNEVVKKSNELVSTIDGAMGSPGINNIISEFNKTAENRVDHIFWRLAQLIMIIGVCVLIIIVVHKLLSMRLYSQEK